MRLIQRQIFLYTQNRSVFELYVVISYFYILGVCPISDKYNAIMILLSDTIVVQNYRLKR